MMMMMMMMVIVMKKKKKSREPEASCGRHTDRRTDGLKTIIALT
jgi:hypothetical protein